VKYFARNITRGISALGINKSSNYSIL